MHSFIVSYNHINDSVGVTLKALQLLAKQK